MNQSTFFDEENRADFETKRSRSTPQVRFPLTAHREAITQAARLRQRTNEKTGAKNKKVSANSDIHIHLQGVIGEAAVAAWAEAFLPGVFDHWLANAVKRRPQTQKPDVWAFHVRACDWGRRLLVKPGDVPDGPYVSTWVNVDTFEAAVNGWLHGSACKVERYWRAELPRPAFLVPVEDLKSLEELEAISRDVREKQLAERTAK